MLVVNCEVNSHSLIYEMLPTELPHHFRILILRHFDRKRENDPSGQLRIPLIFDSLNRIPKCVPVRKLRRSICRKHDLGMNNLMLVPVAFRFLIVFRKETAPALVGSPGNGRLAFAALADGYLEMRTWHKHHFLSSVHEKTDTFRHRSVEWKCEIVRLRFHTRSPSRSAKRSAWTRVRKGIAAESSARGTQFLLG